MAIDATVTDIVQEINDARVDMQSFASFMFKPANVMITRRLAPDTHSLQHYLGYLDAIKLLFTQETGSVTVGDKTITAISQQIATAIDTIIKSGGRVAYATHAAMTADAANIPANSVIEIGNDTEANNGIYLYNGTSFIKSAYDPIAVAKTYTDQNHAKSLEIFGTTKQLRATVSSNSGQMALSKQTGNIYQNNLYDVTRQAETTALLARFISTPSDLDVKAINRLIYDLKQAGVWGKLDGLWIARTTSFDDSKLNWISANNNLTTTNTAPTTWDASTSTWVFSQYKFNTGFNLSQTNTRYSQNDMTIGGLIDTRTDMLNFLGAFDGAKGLTFSYEIIDKGIGFRLNQQTRLEHNVTSNIENDLATVVATRSGNTVTSYMDGEIVKSEQSLSVAPINQTIRIGELNDTVKSGDSGLYAVFIGASLTADEVALTNVALQLYLSRFSKNIAVPYAWENQGLLYPVLGRINDDFIDDVNDDRTLLKNYLFDGEQDNISPLHSVAGVIDETIVNQEYLGGYVEIQPDSYIGGTVPATDSTTDTWGFPQSLTNSEQMRLRNELFTGDGKGLQYIRFPLGFAYRGYRNIDPVTNVARNMGERYKGQNAALRKLFEKIALAGGGLAPEYWCPPPHWLTSRRYHLTNEITAGGSYPRGTTLASIRTTDPAQYAAQIDAFTDAIVDDYEYLHTNIAPVRMYGLSNEPSYNKQEYGACRFDAETYSDILLALHPKVQSSAVLSEWNGEPNEVLLHVASSDEFPYWEKAAKLEAEHPEYIWGYTHHMIRLINGENFTGVSSVGGDYYRSTMFANALEGRKNVWLNEYEYFKPDTRTPEWMCGNNMLAYINGVTYSDSRLIMPIIHICKQLGATSLSTNTQGYALTQVNLQKGYGLAPNDPANTANADYGTWRPVAQNYNAWRFIADNLPIGAVRIGGIPAFDLYAFNYVVYKFADKLIVLIVNNKDADVELTLNFAKSRAYNGKIYNVTMCGKTLEPKEGQQVAFTVPKHSAQAWIEV